jgi:hypothetical protein
LFTFTSDHTTTSAIVRTLDGMGATMSPALSTPLLVKLEVLGFGINVIRGGRNTLATCSVCIVEVSVDTLYEGQVTLAQIVRELNSLSFGYFGNVRQVYAGDGHVIYIDAVFNRLPARRLSYAKPSLQRGSVRPRKS